MMEIYADLYELIDELKQEEEYKALLNASIALEKEDVKALLFKNKEIQQKYFELKKYSQHIDLSDIKEDLKEVKQQMANHPDILHYYECYRVFNERLQTISKLLFEGISDDLSFDEYII